MLNPAQKNQSQMELRQLYGDDYVSRFPRKDNGRLSRLIPLMDLGPGMRVVDVACGNGILLELIHNSVGQYHGVDFSSEFIEAARWRQEKLKVENASFYCESIATFSNRFQHTFDRAFAMDFSEHVYDDDFVETANAILRSLKPRGRLYLHTPNAEFFVEILKDKGVLRQFPEHIAVRNANDNVELLRKAGFESVRVTFLPHYLQPLAWLDMASAVPSVGKYFRARLFIECRAESGV